MNRKLVGVAVAVIAALIGTWLFWVRDRDNKEPAGDGSARSAKVEPTPTASAKPNDAAAPRGMTPLWSLDVDREGPLRLEGQVVGPDGKGVAKASVWLSSVPPRTAVSDDDGTFAFDKLVGRTYALGARTDSLIGGPVSYKLTATSDPVVIRVGPGAAVVVTVQDETKRPIAGAEVSVGRRNETTAKTDDKGEAKLAPVSPGWVGVEAKAAGYASASNFTTVGSSGAVGRLTITMRKGFAVSGRVIDETGKGLAKVRVGEGRDVWDSDGFLDDDPEHGKKSAITDDKGNFTIAALEPGQHTLTALDGVHAPGRSSPITVTDRAVTGVEITMKAGGLLAGTVVDVDGKPVPFATVKIAGTGQQMWTIASRQATCDDKGAFEIKGLARAKLQARAESETAASKLTDFDLTEKPVVRDAKLVLDVVGTISGIVVDEQGAPVPEVQVNAFPDILGGASMEGIALAGMSSATSDGAGAFTIQGLPDGAYRLWAARSHTGAQEWGQQGTAAKTGDKNVRITLASPGGIEGKVVLENSSTLPKLVNVTIGSHPPTPAREGAFEVKDVNPGTYDVTFRGPEFAELVKRDVEVEPGKTTDMGTVTLRRGRKLVGRVVDGKGKSVAGAKIKLGDMLWSVEGQEDKLESFEELGGIRSTVSDQDGAFTLIGVPPKATSAAADHPDAGRSLAVLVPEGAGDPPPITLVLRGYGSIVGRVTQKGKGVGGVNVTQSTKNGGAQLSFVQTDDQGNFTMRKVPEGTIVLNAMQPKSMGMSMKSASVTVQVTAGKESKVTIDIPIGDITLAVTIKPKAGDKVDAAQVFLFGGNAAPANAKQLTEAFLGGGAQGMKFWFGAASPPPEFDELVAGDYSVCTIPITGSLQDAQFMQRLQENMEALRVYCTKVKLAPGPAKQAVTQEVPAMTPLPAPATNEE